MGTGNTRDIQVASATFVGRRGQDVMTFACLVDGRYAILRNGGPVGVWGPVDLAYCLHVYLRMVDRPTRPDRHGERRAGAAPGRAGPSATRDNLSRDLRDTLPREAVPGGGAAA